MIHPLLHGVGAYPREAQIGPAQWSHHDLIVLRRGSACFTVAGQSLFCDTGSALFIPSGHSFSGEAGEKGCVIWVQHFRVLKEGGFKPALILPKKPVVWRGSGNREWSRALMRQAGALQKTKPTARELLEHVLFLLFHALQEDIPSGLLCQRSSNRKIATVMDFVQGHPYPLPSIEQLAARAGWSASYFRREFQRCCGLGAGAWLRELRMCEARRLLQESNFPIKEIAARLGYSDPVSFHRAFANHTGETPARFRAAAPRVV